MDLIKGKDHEKRWIMSSKRRKEKKSQKLREKYYEKRIPLHPMSKAGRNMGNMIRKPIREAFESMRPTEQEYYQDGEPERKRKSRRRK